MKNIENKVAIIILLAALLTITALSAVAEESTNSTVLIAYFTYAENIDTTGMTPDAISSASAGPTTNAMGNIQVMAQVLEKRTGGQIYPIHVQTPYAPAYTDMHDGALDEQRQGNMIPLVGAVENMDGFGLVYLGTPIWGGALPQPVVTFLSTYDFSGKTIVLFGVNLGSSFDGLAGQIQQLCPDAVVAEHFSLNARTGNDEAEQAFSAWLDELSFN